MSFSSIATVLMKVLKTVIQLYDGSLKGVDIFYAYVDRKNNELIESSLPMCCLLSLNIMANGVRFTSSCSSSCSSSFPFQSGEFSSSSISNRLAQVV